MTAKMLSIIIPAFNEEACLSQLLLRLDAVIETHLMDFPVEVIVVDDHSGDGTCDILSENVGVYPWLNYIRLLKNSGSHVAILAGLSVCKGDLAFIMGADLQDPPEIIPQFIREHEKGHKIVLGERMERTDPLVKRLPSAIFNSMMSRFVLPEFPVNGGDVFLLDRDIINAVLQCEEKNANIFVLMLSLCRDVGTVGYKRLSRYAGVSKWNFSKLFKLAYDSVITVGYLPLRLVFWVGIISFGISMLIAAYAVTAKLMGFVSLEGWTSVLVAVTGIGGLNLVSVSVLGEYLWRNFDQTRRRPIFILEQVHMQSASAREIPFSFPRAMQF